MYLLNNLKFDIYAQHTLDDVQYPRGWFFDADNRAALGIVEVPDPVYPDDNLYTTSENPDGSLTITPRTTENLAARQAHAVIQLQADIVQQTQQRLDAFAQTKGYDGIKSACAYVGCSVPSFATEGAYCRNKMAETWATLYTVMAEVQAGTRPMPTGFADVEPLLPALGWPA